MNLAQGFNEISWLKPKTRYIPVVIVLNVVRVLHRDSRYQY